MQRRDVAMGCNASRRWYHCSHLSSKHELESQHANVPTTPGLQDCHKEQPHFHALMDLSGKRKQNYFFRLPLELSFFVSLRRMDSPERSKKSYSSCLVSTLLDKMQHAWLLSCPRCCRSLDTSCNSGRTCTDFSAWIVWAWYCCHRWDKDGQLPGRM